MFIDFKPTNIHYKFMGNRIFSQVHFLSSNFFFLKGSLFFCAEETWFSNYSYFCIYITLLIYEHCRYVILKKTEYFKQLAFYFSD